MKTIACLLFSINRFILATECAGSDPEKYYGWGGYSEEQRRGWYVSFYNSRYEERRPGYKRDTDQYQGVLRMNTPLGSPAWEAIRLFLKDRDEGVGIGCGQKNPNVGNSQYDCADPSMNSD